MQMTPWVAPGDTMGHPPEGEVGSLSRLSDLAGPPGAGRDAAGGQTGGAFAVSACGLVRWFGGCSVGFPMVRALTFVLLACLLVARDARAEGQVPPTTELPAVLSLADAIRIFRARGLDLLIAEAAVRSAEGDVDVAGAVPNPVGNAGYGRVLNYDPGGCDQCSANYWAVGLSDSAALEDALSGKRGLRLKAARNALAAAKLSRVDAQRTLEFQVKAAYLQIAQAVLAQRFAKEVVDSNQKTLELFQARLKGGAINEGDLARVETQKLESDQALDAANEGLRQARIALAFLVGVRGIVPDFEVDTGVLSFGVPPPLSGATEEGLLRAAIDHRPDLVAAGYQKASAQASIELAKRQKLPDITLSVNYSQTGTGATAAGGAISPPTIVFGVSAPLPVFYQMQGELRKAEAAYDTNALGQAKTTAQVVNDVSSGYAAYVTARQLVQRMESGGLLQSAKTARDITRLQFEKGAAGLTDLLDAQRTYIATNVEYIQDVTNYWTAVYQLEQAVGMELH
jgi:cobalt-zinc-cadmium efflux system outer membrane protein